MILSDCRLLRWYRRANRRWYGGELPDDIDVLFAPTEQCCGYVTQDEGGAFLICINPAYALDMNMAKLTLLHEMAHMKLWPNVNHGPRFQREMQRLAAAGAMNGLW